MKDFPHGDLMHVCNDAFLSADAKADAAFSKFVDQILTERDSRHSDDAAGTDI